MRYWVMSKEEISEYLKKAKELGNTDLVTYISRHGTLNDIDYHIEVMKQYYPDGRPLIIRLGGINDGKESI
jgi:hypothetical protein